MCLFHNKNHLEDNYEEHKKELLEKLKYEINQSISNNKPLFCIGFYLPDFTLSNLDISREFNSSVYFVSAQFHGHIDFTEATFKARATFYSCTFKAAADFSKAKFEGRSKVQLGRLHRSTLSLMLISKEKLPSLQLNL
jgi:hypothetical protein